MEKRIQLLSLAVMVSVGMMLSSCGNIDIVKRKYRPGFHVDITKKNQKPKGKKEKTTIEKRQKTINSFEQGETAKSKKVETLPQPPQVIDETVSASLSVRPDVKKGKGKEKVLKTMNDLIVKPFGELKRERMGREMRMAVFDRPEDKEGWSVVAIMATGFALLALILLALGIYALIVLSAGTAVIALAWWVFALLALFFGIAAMVLGIVGLKKTGYGEKHGRAFALVGMIVGIVSVAFTLIPLFIAGLLWLIITGAGN